MQWRASIDTGDDGVSMRAMGRGRRGVWSGNAAPPVAAQEGPAGGAERAPGRGGEPLAPGLVSRRDPRGYFTRVRVSLSGYTP